MTSNIGKKILQFLNRKKGKIGVLAVVLFLDLVLLGVTSQKSPRINQGSQAPLAQDPDHLAACPKNPGVRSPRGDQFPLRSMRKEGGQDPRFKRSTQTFSSDFSPEAAASFARPEPRRRTFEQHQARLAERRQQVLAEKKEQQEEPAPISLEKQQEMKKWEDKQAYARKVVSAVQSQVKQHVQEGEVPSVEAPELTATELQQESKEPVVEAAAIVAPQPEETPVITAIPAMDVTKKEDEPTVFTPLKNKHSCEDQKENSYTVNFEDISVLELLQFVSRISGTNFVFDSSDLQFNVTIVSHDPTSVDDLSTILLQVLKMHDLKVVEQGNNVLIYRNPHISKLSTVVTDGSARQNCEAVVVTRVFRLYSVSPSAAVNIIQPLLSHDAIVSASEATRHIIVSDIAGNIDKVEELLYALDSPGSTIDMSEYEVKYANPAALISYCQDVLSTMAEGESLQIFVQPGTNKIFVVSSPRLTTKAMQLLRSLDVPEMAHTLDDVTNTSAVTLSPSASANPKNLRFFMYKLKYQNGAAIAGALQDIGYNLYVTTAMDEDFINTLNSIQWLDVNNSIVIIGNQANVDRVVSLLNGLDLPPKQVYIEVLILETSLEKSWDFGVQWAALGNDQEKVAYASGLLSNVGVSNAANASIPPAIPSPAQIPLPTPGQLAGLHDMMYGSSAFGLGIIGNVLSHKGKSFLTLGGLLSALDQDGDTVVVLNPRIMAQDTQKASFFVGQTIPYQTTNTIIQETGTVTQNIEYEDIGVNLVVVSTVAPNNVVTLQIEQTISELHSAQGVLTPVTDKTYAATRLQVPDGCFLVMSGHVRDKTTKIISGVPVLSSIPLLRGLFSRTIEQRQKRNIMIFIKPKVITSFQEGTDITNKEGYRYNWEADHGSMRVAPRPAPECLQAPVVREENDFKTLDMEAQ